MRKIFLFLMVGLVYGCGARKVNKNSHSVIEESKTSITEQTSTKEIELERKRLWELIYKLNFKSDNIIIYPDGKVEISQPVIASESKETKQEKEKENIVQTDKTVSLDSKIGKTDKSESKNTDKKPFNWSLTIIIVAIIIVAIVVVSKKLHLFYPI